MTVLRSVMLGCGSYLPSQILTNEELGRKVDTSDDWIVQRTGIHERRIAAPGELTSDMAISPSLTISSSAGISLPTFSSVSMTVTMIGRSDEKK